MNTNDDTVKIVGLPVLDEKDYAQIKYDEALNAMMKNPTMENIEAFGEANRHLYEVMDSYRIGQRLLLQHSRQLHTV